MKMAVPDNLHLINREQQDNKALVLFFLEKPVRFVYPDTLSFVSFSEIHNRELMVASKQFSIL
jgi:hypothetical protein